MINRLLAFLVLLLPAGLAFAQATGGLPAVTSTPAAGGGTTYSLTIQTLLLMTALTFIPAVVLMMTGFTRIVIVLSLLRHAMGTQTAPPNQVIVGLALFLTFFVMSPVLDRVYTEAYLPLSENRINVMQAAERAAIPMRGFMLKQTRESDLALFAGIARKLLESLELEACVITLDRHGALLLERDRAGVLVEGEVAIERTVELARRRRVRGGGGARPPRPFGSGSR